MKLEAAARCLTREQWSEEEQIHLRPGHHWIFEFGEAPDGTSCEFTFAFSPLQPKRNGVVYKGMRFYNGDRALKVKRKPDAFAPALVMSLGAAPLLRRLRSLYSQE